VTPERLELAAVLGEVDFLEHRRRCRRAGGEREVLEGTVENGAGLLAPPLVVGAGGVEEVTVRVLGRGEGVG
jgi:hypothetical protein